MFNDLPTRQGGATFPAGIGLAQPLGVRGASAVPPHFITYILDFVVALAGAAAVYAYWVANRRRIAVDYLGGLLGPRPLVSLGLVDERRAAFAESEHLGEPATS